LAECLREIFNTEQLDFEHNFSEAGGDSLGAIQLITLLIEKKFTIEIVDIINPEHTLRDIARLLVPHVGSIVKKPAGVWEKPEEWSDEQFNRVLERYGQENIERLYDVGALQNLMLGYCLAHPEGSTNQMQIIYRIEGILDLERLADTFALIQTKYPVLKTVIVYPSTHPKQLIISNKGLEITIMRDEPLDRVIERSYTEGLSFDTPFRVVLLKEGSRYTYLILNIHHIITDGWSIDMIMRDLESFYRKLLKAASLSSLREEAEQWSKTVPAYEDFLYYANTTLDQVAAVSYFANLVAGYEGYHAKPHIIPDYDGSKPAEGHPQGIEYRAIPHHVTEGIRATARRHQVNVASVYEGVYAFMAYTESGSSDLMYRRVSTGRGVSVEKIRSISGTFVATPPTRVRFSADMTFEELFKVVENQFNHDMRYEYADFAKMLERIGADILVYSPYFSYEQLPYKYALTDDVSLYPYAEDTIESIDLFMITIQPLVGSTLNNLRIQYNKSRFSKATIDTFLNAYLSALEYVITHTNARLSEVPVVIKKTVVTHTEGVH
jgi:acyl carrier protein